MNRQMILDNFGLNMEMRQIVDEINSLEPRYVRLTDDALRAKTDDFRREISLGASLDDVLPEAYAAVREAARRALGQRHYDVQLIAGIALHHGKIAEMKPGEGKTLVATLPAYLNSLTGDGVHVVTLNDYLARRDVSWMGPVYARLGVSVGVIESQSALLYDPDFQGGLRGLEHMRPALRRDAYLDDITYGTSSQIGFDYLRDNLAMDVSTRVQRGRAYAIVDDVDNILIDESWTPLVITGPGPYTARDYTIPDEVAASLNPDSDYAVDERRRAVALTENGYSKLERQLGVSNLYRPENFEAVRKVENALKAQVIYQRDRDYVVQDGQVAIVDESTGRPITGQRYLGGLHQAIEAKEGVRVHPETIAYASITPQSYFRMYDKLSGMTGAASTEAEEFKSIYNLDVVAIATNLAMAREDADDLLYRDQNSKYLAVVAEIERRYRKGQPVLVDTADMGKSEMLSDLLGRNGIPHEVSNAKHHEREAIIVAQAGKPGAVTVATNMASRGTEILLGGSPDEPGVSLIEWREARDKVIRSGGLYVIGTERHKTRRSDDKLRDLAGRQGDPGETQFYIALDDQLVQPIGGDRMQTFVNFLGVDDEILNDSGMMSRNIDNIQVKIMGNRLDVRKRLVEFDEVVNAQRAVIYGERDKILAGADLKANIQRMLADHLSDVVQSTLEDSRPADWDVESLNAAIAAVIPPPDEFEDEDYVRSLEVDEVEAKVIRHAERAYDVFEAQVAAKQMREIERHLLLRSIDANWVQHLTIMENLRRGNDLQAFGHRNPLDEYRTKGTEQFQILEEKIHSDVARSIFRLLAGSSLP